MGFDCISTISEAFYLGFALLLHMGGEQPGRHVLMNRWKHRIVAPVGLIVGGVGRFRFGGAPAPKH